MTRKTPNGPSFSSLSNDRHFYFKEDVNMAAIITPTGFDYVKLETPEKEQKPAKAEKPASKKGGKK